MDNNLNFRHPICIAAGPWSGSGNLGSIKGIDTVAAIFTKTVTADPIMGSGPLLDWWDLGGGNWLNHVGLANWGFDWFVNEELPRLLELGPEVFVSLAGTAAEVTSMAREAVKAGAHGIEINLSCPNVPSHWINPHMDTDDVRKEISTPVIGKYSSQNPVVYYGPITLGNTIRAGAYVGDLREERYQEGGLSGPAVFPINLRAVKNAVERGYGPVIGCGGITGPRQVRDYLEAGAVAVQVGSGLLSNPDLAVQLSIPYV